MRASRLGTIIQLPDGRIGTTVYHGLDGIGIKWGRHNPPPEDFVGTNGGLFDTDIPEDWPWFPDAMLRDPYPGADLPCVGTEFTILE